MKPTKNRVMCPECFKQKMLFETQKEADAFIKWNGEDIDTNGGELRSYYCPACGGWHISSKPHKVAYDHTTENLINRFEKMKETTKKPLKIPVDVSGVPTIIQTIIDELPKEIDNKKALRKYLTEYFAIKGIDNQTLQQKIRTDLYWMIDTGGFDIINKKVYDDNEIFKLISEEDKEDFIKFKKALKTVIAEHKIKADKEQRNRITDIWYDYNYKKHHEDKVYNIYREIIKEVPKLEVYDVRFIRKMVDSYLKVNKIDFSKEEKDRCKRLTLSYYIKQKQKSK